MVLKPLGRRWLRNHLPLLINHDRFERLGYLRGSRHLVVIGFLYTAEDSQYTCGTRSVFSVAGLNKILHVILRVEFEEASALRTETEV